MDDIYNRDIPGLKYILNVDTNMIMLNRGNHFAKHQRNLRARQPLGSAVQGRC